MADIKIVKPKLAERNLYLGDNGRCFCGTQRCAGMTAFYSGRDLSGQKVMPLTGVMVAANGFDATSFACESCGKGLS
jgi:hypothetical protein